MKQELNEIKEQYKNLLSILNNDENDHNIQYLKTKIKKSIDLINNYLATSSDPNQYQNDVQTELTRIYKDINRPRVGLSDYFIWDDDYEKRVEANKELDDIKDALFYHFKKYIY